MKKKYLIPFKVICYVDVTIEADSKDDAIEKAWDEVYLSQYVGNGGNDKLIGVSDEHLSVYAGEEFECIEGDILKIEDEN